MKKRLTSIALALCTLFHIMAFAPARADVFADDGMLSLINREQRLPKAYEPAELVKPDVKTRKKSQQERIFMRPEAAHALEALFAAAESEMAYTLLAISGYRTYGEQQILFNGKVEETGSRDKAMRTVAPAGASEHQSGLAMDVLCTDYSGLNKSFADSDEGKWLSQNAHRFGFIVRYKAEWSDITGYAYEPWHIRYVGVTHAMAIFALDIPLETYVGYLSRLPAFVAEEAPSKVFIEAVGRALGGDENAYLALCAAKDESELRDIARTLLPATADYQTEIWRERPTPTPVPTPRPSPAPYVETEDEVFFPGAERTP